MLRALLLVGCTAALQPVKLPDGFKAPSPNRCKSVIAKYRPAEWCCRISRAARDGHLRPRLAAVLCRGRRRQTLRSEPGAEEYASVRTPQIPRRQLGPARGATIKAHNRVRVRELALLSQGPGDVLFVRFEVENRPVPRARGGAFAKEPSPAGRRWYLIWWTKTRTWPCTRATTSANIPYKTC